MKRYFNSREKAQRHLEWRRACAIKQIEKAGDKLQRDDSCVVQGFIDATDRNRYVGELLMTSNNPNMVRKWFVIMAMYTDAIIKELKDVQYIDPEAELTEVLNNSKKY